MRAMVASGTVLVEADQEAKWTTRRPKLHPFHIRHATEFRQRNQLFTFERLFEACHCGRKRVAVVLGIRVRADDVHHVVARTPVRLSPYKPRSDCAGDVHRSAGDTKPPERLNGRALAPDQNHVPSASCSGRQRTGNSGIGKFLQLHRDGVDVRRMRAYSGNRRWRARRRH